MEEEEEEETESGEEIRRRRRERDTMNLKRVLRKNIAMVAWLGQKEKGT